MERKLFMLVESRLMGASLVRESFFVLSDDVVTSNSILQFRIAEDMVHSFDPTVGPMDR